MGKVIRIAPRVLQCMVDDYTRAAVAADTEAIERIRRRARFMAFDNNLTTSEGLLLDDLMTTCKRWLEAATPTQHGA